MQIELNKVTGWTFTGLAAIAGVTIIMTAFAMRPHAPVSCVDQKVEIADLTAQLAASRTERAEIAFGTCHQYDSQGQQVCRKRANYGGDLYIIDIKTTGANVVEGDVE